jgi:hypothetical protein
LEISTKKINGIYGYRTAKAMQNDNIWQFANSTFNAAFLKYSLFSLLGGLLLSTSSKLLTWEPMVLVMLSILVAIVKTERALSDKFTDEGKEK